MPTKPKVIKPVAVNTDSLKVAALAAAKKPRATQKALADTSAAAPARAKPAAMPPSAAASVGKDTAALNKKELIDKIVTVTGSKKNMVRDIVEAALIVLGDALSKGTMLNLPPLGKVKVSRPSDETGRAMTVKLRRSSGGPHAAAKVKQTLADSED